MAAPTLQARAHSGPSYTTLLDSTPQVISKMQPMTLALRPVETRPSHVQAPYRSGCGGERSVASRSHRQLPWRLFAYERSAHVSPHQCSHHRNRATGGRLDGQCGVRRVRNPDDLGHRAPKSVTEGARIAVRVRVAAARQDTRVRLQELQRDALGDYSWVTIRSQGVKGTARHVSKVVATAKNVDQYRSQVAYRGGRTATSHTKRVTVWRWISLIGYQPYYETNGVILTATSTWAGVPTAPTPRGRRDTPLAATARRSAAPWVSPIPRPTGPRRPSGLAPRRASTSAPPPT